MGAAVSEYRFIGTERVTIELDGFFEPVLELPSGLALDLVDGRARVSLFAFHVDDLRVVGMPVVSASYAEVLWRIAVRRGEQRAWWVAACDLHARGPGWAARRWVRYPVRKARVAVTEARVAVDDFAFEVGAAGDRAIVERRTLLTGALYEVPWGDDGTGAHRAPVTSMTDSLGRVTVGRDIEWANTAIIRRGRQHRCGVASACH